MSNTERHMGTQETAVIIGAGPAGLTAALEFCRHSSIRPIVLEASQRIGGISCTIRHHGNRIDIGGHRFFSKSDRVMDWWAEIMPVAAEGANTSICYQNKTRTLDARTQPSCDDGDGVMLVRPRKSRIYFMRSFFDYPLSLSPATLRKLGLLRTLRILASYIKAQLRPHTPEESLQDFLINRFGRQLYLTFFKSYTEKVWAFHASRFLQRGERSGSRVFLSARRPRIFSRDSFRAEETRRISSRRIRRPRSLSSFFTRNTGPASYGSGLPPWWKTVGERFGWVGKLRKFTWKRVKTEQSAWFLSLPGIHRANWSSLAETTSSPPCRCANCCAPSMRRCPLRSRQSPTGCNIGTSLRLGFLSIVCSSPKRMVRLSRTPGFISRNRR